MTQVGKSRRRAGGYTWRDTLEKMEGQLDEMVQLLDGLRKRAETKEATNAVAQVVLLAYQVRVSVVELGEYQGKEESQEGSIQ